MDTNKAAYWIALGVLAFGLNSEYRHGNLVALHRVADRARSAMCRISTRAERALAVVIGATDSQRFAVDDLWASADRAEAAREQGELLREQARAQAEMLRDRVRDEIQAQANVMRAQTEVRRAVIEQIRIRTRSQARMGRVSHRPLMVACPKTGAGIVVSGMRFSEVSPDVEVDVDDSF